MNKETFVKLYSEENDLLKKLNLIYELFDNSTNKIDCINFLLKQFNSYFYHLSEIKTVLVISKQFEDYDSVKEHREALVKIYNKKKNE